VAGSSNLIIHCRTIATRDASIMGSGKHKEMCGQFQGIISAK